jgi:DNA repair exonuclease SbcCD ATPase subunit
MRGTLPLNVLMVRRRSIAMHMAKSPNAPSELVRYAEAVERELRRLEELSRGALQAKLSSEKNIARAGRSLQQAIEQQERLAQELRAFGQAIQGMQARQEVAMAPLGARATELESRMLRLGEHVQRFSALGLRAKETAEALSEISESTPAGHNPEGASLLIDADERVRGLLEEANAMAHAAETDEFTDIARESHALGERIQAMRKRLSELLRAKAIGAS